LEEETERGDLETEIGNLKASIGRLEQKAGVRYRFKSKEEIIALEENPDHPYVCPAADCKRSYKRKDRLHQHIRKECDLKKLCSREHKFLYDLIYKPFCFRCRKTFSQRRFTIHVRDAHGDRSASRLELFQEFLSSMTQDYDPDAPDIDNADKHRQASAVDVILTRAEESSPSSSGRCLGTMPDARSVQPQEEQHIFRPSWIDSDFTMSQEQHTFNPLWINTDFTVPQEQHAFDPLWINTDFTMPQEQHTFDPSEINSDFEEHHTFVPVWTDSRSSSGGPLVSSADRR